MTFLSRLAWWLPGARRQRDDLTRAKALACRRGEHEDTVDADTPRITLRCLWCGRRESLGIAFCTGSNKRRRRPA